MATQRNCPLPFSLFKKIGTFVFFLIFSIAAADDDSFPELENEIKELQKKISSCKDNIKSVKKKIEKDKQSFNKYENQQNGYYNNQNDEMDSLKNDYNRLQSKTDSLAKSIQQVKHKQRELDLLQERFSKQLLDACKELKEALLQLPPGNIKSQIGSIDFLHSELTVKAVDNAEALERLWQILSVIAEGGQSVDVFPGQSPVPFISGQASYIRLGYAYLAVVNEKGTAGALWVVSSDSVGGAWIENKNPQQLLALKKCVSIRQGNAVPEIINIPFNHFIRGESQDRKGGSQ